MEDTRAKTYIDLFKRLEMDIRVKYNLENEDSAVTWFRKNVNYAKRKGNELRYCADVRNLLQHGQEYEDYDLDDKYLVTPSDAIIRTLQEYIDWFESIPTTDKLGIKKADICAAGFDDHILPVIRTMAEESYTCVPILKDGRVEGVFSENTLMRYVLAEEVGFDENDVFSQIESLLRLDANDSETYKFVGVSEPATVVIDMFQDALKHQQRLNAVFVTNTGKSREKLLGMITSWDMAAFF